MRLPQVQLLYVLEALFVDSSRRLFPLEKSHSSDHMPRLDCPSVSAETLKITTKP